MILFFCSPWFFRPKGQLLTTLYEFGTQLGMLVGMVVGLVDVQREKKGMMIIFPHVLGGDAAAAAGHDELYKM